MSKQLRRASISRRDIIIAALGVIVGSTLGLFFSGALMPNAVRMVSLIVSIGLLIVLAVFMIVFAVNLEVKRRTVGTVKGWASVGFVAAAILLFVIASTTINWGVGPFIRSRFDWSPLPEGNLLVAGGLKALIGWLYLTLFMLLVVVLSFEVIKERRRNWAASLVQAKEEQRIRKTSKKTQQSAAAANEAAVSQPNPMKDLLGDNAFNDPSPTIQDFMGDTFTQPQPSAEDLLSRFANVGRE